ncbi:MAG TPA: non-canonical purine NTP pyrophosphatase [Bryobacteraceae bacterium]|nr:non-canonical purine NTP pyrophosphatase [Bryobacteraceae bacterium]
MTVFCATSNPGKLREFLLAARCFAADQVRFQVLPGLDSVPPCAESGSSFEENATQKALHYSSFGPGIVFADDSGLVVPALDGEPGVRSARFAGEDATDADNNRLLLEKLAAASDRRAIFVCVLALAEQGRLRATFRGEVAGVILDRPRGAGGFGYDPLFYYPPLSATFAELSPEQKLQVSHRGVALRKMIGFLLAQASHA